MNKPITLYVRKQPVIIHTNELQEIQVTEIESHNKKDIAKALAKLLNKNLRELKLAFDTGFGNKGEVIYNDGCRKLEFNLGFIQK